MIDAYEVGQRLTAEDFIDDIYFPSAKWDYAEVEAIDDDTVTLRYVDTGMKQEETEVWTRAEMEEMLGWNASKDDSVFDIIDERAEEGLGDGDFGTRPETDSAGFPGDILTNSQPEEKIGSYTLLRGSTPAIIRESGNKVTELRIFSSTKQARSRFKELTR